jgi:hypothetical protein
VASSHKPNADKALASCQEACKGYTNLIWKIGRIARDKNVPEIADLVDRFFEKRNVYRIGIKAEQERKEFSNE